MNYNFGCMGKKKKQQKYNLIYAKETMGHVKAIDKRHHSFIKEETEEQLTYEPLKQTRNKKSLTKPTWLGENVWELRFGQGNIFRVFYKVEFNDVLILAIGIKKKERLYIGGKVVSL